MTDRYAETDTWPNPPASQPPARPATLAASEASRVAAYAEAIMGGAERAALLTVRNPGEVANAYRDARAVVAVADAERNEAYARGYQAAREHWKARAESAERELAAIRETLEATNDAVAEAATARAESAERARDAALAEVTELRDRLGRVEALADEWTAEAERVQEFADRHQGYYLGVVGTRRNCRDHLLAALAVPVTGDTEDASPVEAKCPTCGGSRDDRRPAEGQALCPESFHFRTLASPAAKDAARPSRYDQCDETCTTDCGHCKGAASPTERATEGGAK